MSDGQLSLKPYPQSRVESRPSGCYALSTSSGLCVLVDAEDRDRVVEHTWYISAGGYAVRSIRADGKKTMVYMHRLVSQAPSGLDVDHINGNKLDNRRGNLRLCTRAENVRNARLSKNNTSGCKGVSWDRRRGLWEAKAMVARRTMHLGYFQDRIDAALAYDIAVLDHFGDFAHPNYLKREYGIPFRTREAAVDSWVTP